MSYPHIRYFHRHKFNDTPLTLWIELHEDNMLYDFKVDGKLEPNRAGTSIKEAEVFVKEGSWIQVNPYEDIRFIFSYPMWKYHFADGKTEHYEIICSDIQKNTYAQDIVSISGKPITDLVVNCNWWDWDTSHLEQRRIEVVKNKLDKLDTSEYNDTCKLCGSPCYVGFMSTECSNSRCERYRNLVR